MKDRMIRAGYAIVRGKLPNELLDRAESAVNGITDWQRVFGTSFGQYDDYRLMSSLNGETELCDDLRKALRPIWTLLYPNSEANEWTALRSLPGGEQQAAHLDFALPHDYVHLDHENVPAAMLVSLADGTKLHTYGWNRHVVDGADEEIHVLKKGEVLIFRGDMIHAGAAYDTENIRLHAYLDVKGQELWRHKKKNNNSDEGVPAGEGGDEENDTATVFVPVLQLPLGVTQFIDEQGSTRFRCEFCAMSSEKPNTVQRHMNRRHGFRVSKNQVHSSSDESSSSDEQSVVVARGVKRATGMGRAPAAKGGAVAASAARAPAKKKPLAKKVAAVSTEEKAPAARKKAPPAVKKAAAKEKAAASTGEKVLAAKKKAAPTATKVAATEKAVVSTGEKVSAGKGKRKATVTKETPRKRTAPGNKAKRDWSEYKAELLSQREAREKAKVSQGPSGKESKTDGDDAPSTPGESAKSHGSIESENEPSGEPSTKRQRSNSTSSAPLPTRAVLRRRLKPSCDQDQSSQAGANEDAATVGDVAGLSEENTASEILVVEVASAGATEVSAGDGSTSGGSDTLADLVAQM